MKNVLYAIDNSNSSVSANGILPISTVIRRYGSGAVLSGNNILVQGGPCGAYHKVTVNVTVTGGAAGDAIIALYQNGSAIIGATAESTITTASTEYRTLSFTAVIRTYRNEASTLSIINTGSITLNAVNFGITVEEV